MAAIAGHIRVSLRVAARSQTGIEVRLEERETAQRQLTTARKQCIGEQAELGGRQATVADRGLRA